MLQRNLMPQIAKAIADTPVIFLNGARQVGKSTLVQQLISKKFPAQYVTLDNLTTLNIARQEPERFIAGFDEPVILDEVQRVPELLLAIKSNVDRKRQAGRFLLTGSANVLLLPHVAESLAGRMEILTLWPLSQGEIVGIKENFIDAVFKTKFIPHKNPNDNLNELISRITNGGYPEVLTRHSSERKTAWFDSYLMSILQRDIRELANIEGLTELPHLLNLLAARAGMLLNYAELARTARLPETTLKRYMTLLQMTFLVQFLPAWSSNLSKRLVKAPKIIINDLGLLSHLQGVTAERLKKDHSILGHLLENFVVTELCKQIGWSETKPKIFHFRAQSGQEVDIILEKADGRLVAIEVKAKSTLTSSDFSGLRFLKDELGDRLQHSILLYLGDTVVPFDKNSYALPVNSLWQEY